MTHLIRKTFSCACLMVTALTFGLNHDTAADDATNLHVLFLGDQGHHRPADRFAQLQPVLAKRGIEMTYTEDVGDLNPTTLAEYDALVLYANIDSIDPQPAQALLDYVAGGGGFVPLHCASFCFRNSDDVVALIGAQFKRHGTGVFRTQIAAPDHPVMRGFGGFESWDETYVHEKHNETDRTVLEYRVDDEGREPWTWVRTQGQGRVFYTAWGHDERTWGNPGFQNLVERGIRWAAGGDPSVVPAFSDSQSFSVPKMTAKRTDVKPFEYGPANLPNYTPSGKWGTQGENLSQMQLPAAPEESLKHFVTPVNFHVELFASEPDLGGKPIAMTWDERGRLWVCETYDYPNDLQPPGQGRDRIRICEDTDGDGRADKFTVFADKLSIPTAIVMYRGGAIVQNGVETLFLKDTDGDDKADVRTVLISNWTLGDTHGGVSNFHYGLDNWIWAMQGYNNSSPIINGQQQQAFRQGFFRFRLNDADPPTVAELEFLRSTNNNTWGLGFSEEGIVFGSTANRNPSEYMPIPNRYYESVRGWSSSVLNGIADTYLFHPITDKIRQVDQHGGYTAGAGHALYTARTYPREYWNRVAFVNGPTGHLVGGFVLNRDGANFHSTSPFNLLASDDEWTAPIMAEVGPDGNVWVIDWYNIIVQHNPTPVGFKTGKGNAYETDLRDKKHGRVYRVVYDAPTLTRSASEELRTPIEARSASEESPRATTSLQNATPEQLIAALKHDNMFWRLQAQRLLIERGQTDIVAALIELVRDPSVDAIGLNVGAIHAIQTLHGLGALDGNNGIALAAVQEALKHPSAGVRRNAVAVLPPTSDSAAAILGAGLLSDPDAQVRLAALLALADMPATQAAGVEIASLLNRPENFQDRWIPDAATSAAAAHDIDFLRAVAERKQPSAKSLEVSSIVAQHLARGKANDAIGPLLVALADADRPVADSIIGGLAAGWPKDRTAKLDDDVERAMARLMTKLSPGSQGQLVKLATTWGSPGFEKYAGEISAALLAVADDSRQTDERRLDAARQLIEFQSSDDEVIDQLLELVTPRLSPALAGGIVDALAASESSHVGPALVRQYRSFTPSAKTAAIRVLLSRPSSTLALLDGVDGGQLQLADLTLDQKQGLAAHPNKQISARAGKLMSQGGGLPNPDRQIVLDELMPLTEQSGDAEAGKLVFKQQCAKCHTHSGEGAKIGPDLTGMSVHSKAELLTNIIDPSRSVEGNFRVYTVVTADGRVLTGLLASESKTAIELFDAEAKKQTVLREDIDELIASPKSLMPEGFEKQVPPEAIVNLLAFLSKRGKFVPLDLSKAATITSTRGMFYDERSTVERLVFPDWSPKVFEGVPFNLVDPQGDRVPNVIMLNGPNGKFPPRMPKSVTLQCSAPAKAIHLLSGVSGWGAKNPRDNGTVSLIVRLHYDDGQTEDHPLIDGQHFADYIGHFDVPQSKFAFDLDGRQVRYLPILPQRLEPIKDIELIKGPDATAPVVMAVTVESPE